MPCRATDVRGVVHIVLSFLISFTRACNDRCAGSFRSGSLTPDHWRRTGADPVAVAHLSQPPSKGNFCTRAKCCVPDGIASSGPRAVLDSTDAEFAWFCRENRRFVDGLAGRTPVVRRAKSGRRRTFRAAATRLSIHRLPAAGGEEPSTETVRGPRAGEQPVDVRSTGSRSRA
jgi:hypothetical protein